MNLKSRSVLIVCLLLFGLGTSCIAASNLAISGDITEAAHNPAGLMGLVTPEFNLLFRLDSNQNQIYQVIYGEPDYGTGAGLLNFIYSPSHWQASYAVATDVLDFATAGLTLHYINHPELEDQYVSTDLGMQFGDFWWLRFGILVENFWQLPIGDTASKLPTNLMAGAALNLADYGVITVDVNDIFDLNSDRKLLFGAKVTPFEQLALLLQWDQHFSFGFEYNYQQLGLGYLYDWQQRQHQLGFGWQF